MSEFDKEILKKLSGYESQVNSDMWNKISDKLPDPEDSSPKTWWLPAMSVIFLLGSMMVAYLLYDNSNNTIMESNVSIENKESSAKQNANLSAKVDQNDAADHKEIKSAVESTTVLDNTTSNRLQSEENSITSSIIENRVTSENKVISHLNDKPIAEIKSDLNDSKIVKNDNKSILSNNTKVLNDNEAISLAMDPEQITESELDLNASSSSLYEQYGTIFKRARMMQENAGEMIEERKESVTIGLLPTLDGEIVTESEEIELMGERLICPSFKNMRFGIFAEAYFSPELAHREFGYKSAISESDYLNKREATEVSQVSFSSGVRIGFMTKSGLGLKSGFNYSQINESFEYVDPEHSKKKTIVITEYIWENNEVIDSTQTIKEIDVEGEYKIRKKNTYKTLDIPVLFTYEWGYKNRLYYGVTAGPMINLKFSQSGMMLEEETLTPIEIEDTKVYNTNVGTSLYLSFSANYQLGQGVDLFVEPNLRHIFKDTTNDGFSLSQKYTTWGLGFGVKCKL